MGSMTKLQAVNEMLEAIKLKPVSALDTNANSDAGQAERVLDRESRRVQTPGFPGNTIPYKEYTAASNVVTLGSDVISIRPTGKSHRRLYAMRYTGSAMQVYDLENDTFTITTGTVIHLEVVIEIPFANCPPDMQDAIVAQAKQTFARRTSIDPVRDSQFTEERLHAEKNAGRAADRVVSDPVAPAPFAVGAKPPGGQG